MRNVIVLQEHTPGTPHHGGTPWGVQYTQLTSTALESCSTAQTDRLV